MNTKIRIIAIAAVATFALSATAQTTSKPSGDITSPSYSTSKSAKKNSAPVSKSAPTITAPDTTSDAPVLATRPVDGQVLLPIGTAIRMKLSAPISTHSSREGEIFNGRVSEDVVIEGRTVIPAGSNMNGRITKLSEPRRFAGRPSIQLTPYWVTLSSGKSLQIAASVVDTSNPHAFNVNDEGRIKGPGISRQDKVEFVAATGTGTVIGSVVSLGTGTWVGAAAGATFATGHWLIRRHPLELPAGTEIIMEISSPVAAPTTALPNVAAGGN
jgi:hypothetical protein